MTNQEAITKLTNIMHDDHYSWHPAILTAFGMAVDALRGAGWDTISRQALKDALVEMSMLEWEQLKKCYPMLEAVDEVPSVSFPQAHENDLISRQATMVVFENSGLDDDSKDTVARVLEQLPSAQPEQRWIPCSERLPEDGEKHYWVCTDTGYQCECRWTNINHFWTDLTTNWHWHIMDIPQYSAVIAWMPLPEPWKEAET